MIEGTVLLVDTTFILVTLIKKMVTEFVQCIVLNLFFMNQMIRLLFFV